MLELARMVSAERPRLPVQFIAFGAEEPRGPADDEHHFGSQQYVAELSRTERDAVVGMVALDRVGVRASYVPVCRSPIGGRNLRDDLRAAARRVDVTSRACELTTSDHWSYAKAGMPAARLGSVPYDGYHTRRDTYGVVDRRQLDRVGSVMWSWAGTGRR
jgi:Zn-dependent M28 family amino/carboxypeptidase